jgi:hypothetical protein
VGALRPFSISKTDYGKAFIEASRCFELPINPSRRGAPCIPVEEPVSFVDTRNNEREGKVFSKPVQTAINGVPFGRPYQSPFAVR